MPKRYDRQNNSSSVRALVIYRGTSMIPCYKSINRNRPFNQAGDITKKQRGIAQEINILTIVSYTEKTKHSTNVTVSPGCIQYFQGLINAFRSAPTYRLSGHIYDSRSARSPPTPTFPHLSCQKAISNPTTDNYPVRHDRSEHLSSKIEFDGTPRFQVSALGISGRFARRLIGVRPDDGHVGSIKLLDRRQLTLV